MAFQACVTGLVVVTMYMSCSSQLVELARLFSGGTVMSDLADILCVCVIKESKPLLGGPVPQEYFALAASSYICVIDRKAEYLFVLSAASAVDNNNSGQDMLQQLHAWLAGLSARKTAMHKGLQLEFMLCCMHTLLPAVQIVYQRISGVHLWNSQKASEAVQLKQS